MNSFKRVFSYIWPQWFRIIIVVISAFLVAILLSVSFMSVIPLMKVVMGEEGLHGWVDRKTCQWQYGVELSVPESVDFIQRSEQTVGYYILVSGVKKKSIGEICGLKTGDRIVGAGKLLVTV
jgi:hypothetical protein